MASPVFSVRFIKTFSVAIWVYWTCPSGHRAVVRQLTVTNTGSGSADEMVTAAGAVIHARAYQAGGPATYQDLRVVLYAGEQVGVYHYASGLSTLISGYLFNDAGGREAYLTDGVEDPEAEPPDQLYAS